MAGFTKVLVAGLMLAVAGGAGLGLVAADPPKPAAVVPSPTAELDREIEATKARLKELEATKEQRATAARVAADPHLLIDVPKGWDGGFAVTEHFRDAKTGNVVQQGTVTCSNPAVLEKLLVRTRKDPTAPTAVLVRCDPRTPYDILNNVLNVVKGAGYPAIAMVDRRPAGKFPLQPYVIEPPDILTLGVFLRPFVEDPNDKTKRVPGDELKPLPTQPIQSDSILVRPDGTVYLGTWGTVPVAGRTLPQATEAIREHVARQLCPDGDAATCVTVVVLLDVKAYNSKKYYVIHDAGGAGEQVTAFPLVGNETVLDAVSQVAGLTAAGKTNVWVSRRSPTGGDQILPVDWAGITQQGVTATNYQLLPGDRLYVKSAKSPAPTPAEGSR